MNTQRANQAKNAKRAAKKPKRRASPAAGAPIRQAKAGGRTRSKARTASTLDRNRGGLAGRRGGAVLEENATGKPSRKSTRGSSDRTKRTTNQQLRAIARASAPSTRARTRR